MKIFWLTKSDFFPLRLAPFLQEHDIVLAQICTDPGRAIASYLQSNADIVVMDFSWYSNTISGVALIKEFLSLDSQMKIMVSTSYYQSEVDNRYKALGATGYLFKDDTPENIIRLLKEQMTPRSMCA